VGEFLVLSPLNVVLGALIVVVMMSSRTILKGLLVVNFLGLGEPCAGGFPPSVVEVEEHVVEVLVVISSRLQLVEMRRNVADLVQVLGSHLTDVEINHVLVVGVDLGHLLLSEA
jgi:hypothetical protein